MAHVCKLSRVKVQVLGWGAGAKLLQVDLGHK